MIHITTSNPAGAAEGGYGDGDNPKMGEFRWRHRLNGFFVFARKAVTFWMICVALEGAGQYDEEMSTLCNEGISINDKALKKMNTRVVCKMKSMARMLPKLLPTSLMVIRGTEATPVYDPSSGSSSSEEDENLNNEEEGGEEEKDKASRIAQKRDAAIEALATDDRDVFAMGDIHGDWNNAIQILSAVGLIEAEPPHNWRGGNAILVQTGDIVDRGIASKSLYALLNRLESQAYRQGGYVVRLLGNHEILNLCRITSYAPAEDIASYGGWYDRRIVWSRKGALGKKLRSLPLAAKVRENVFVHAGLSPAHAKMGLKKLNALARKELDRDECQTQTAVQQMPLTQGPHGPVWMREPTMGQEGVVCKDVEEALTILNAKRMIVGHTFTDGKVKVRCNGHLLMIDTGLNTSVNNSPTLIQITPPSVLAQRLPPSPVTDNTPDNDDEKAAQKQSKEKGGRDDIPEVVEWRLVHDPLQSSLIKRVILPVSLNNTEESVPTPAYTNIKQQIASAASSSSSASSSDRRSRSPQDDGEL